MPFAQRSRLTPLSWSCLVTVFCAFPLDGHLCMSVVVAEDPPRNRKFSMTSILSVLRHQKANRLEWSGKSEGASLKTFQ